MIYKQLALWIAQSASWQSFIDYKLDGQKQADYPFLKRWEDFYIALVGNMGEVMTQPDSADRTQGLLSLARGLEVFSIVGKREKFLQIDYQSNLLYTAALYFIAGYPASSYLLCRSFKEIQFNNPEDEFLFHLLSKQIRSTNKRDTSYEYQFEHFLSTGEESTLAKLKESIDQKAKLTLMEGSYGYLTVQLISMLLNMFEDKNIWRSLKPYGTESFWKKFVDMNLKRPVPVWSFFPSQQEAIEKGLLSNPKSIALKMPTSSGKSSLSELAIYHEIKSRPGSHILYLAPFRALASELRSSLRKHLSELDIKTKAIYGGHVPSAYEKEAIQDVDVLVSTPEKFIAIENSLDESLQFSLVICDEGHLLDDQERGLRYELLLSRLKKRGIETTRFLFISAIIPNITQINEWLGGTSNTVVDSDYRPTTLEFSLLTIQSDGGYTLDVNPESQFPERYLLNNFVTASDSLYSKQTARGEKEVKYKSSNKALSIVVASKCLSAGTVALFAPAKNGPTGVYSITESFIEMLKLGLPITNPVEYADQNTVRRLSDYFDVVFGPEYVLSKSIQFGFLFHHGDLPQMIREVIEDAIRKEQIKFVVCNKTLAEGVNLPIRTIVLSTTRMYNEYTKRLRFMRTRDLKNLVGRAGRAGKETKGSVIVVNKSDYQPIREIINQTGGEPVNGFLHAVVRAVNSYVKEKGIAIDQMTFDELDIIDAIDSSIIDLIAEDIDPDKLEEDINSLIADTLTYYLSNNDQEVRTGLQKITQLRGRKIEAVIRKGEFRFLKKSNSTLRLFENIFPRVDFTNPIWEQPTSPSDAQWLGYITSVLLEIPWLKKSAEDKELTIEQITSIIGMWLDGEWYGEIAIALKKEVQEILPIVNYFVGYELQVNAASTIRAIALKRQEEEMETSPVVLEWSNMLTHGVNSLVQLNLIDIGFNDRLIVQKISDWMKINSTGYNDSISLKALIKVRYNEIRDYIAENSPEITLLKFEETGKFFQDKNLLN